MNNKGINLKKIKGNLILLLTSVIWGASFVSQRVGMEKIPPATFNGIRLLIGALVLLPVIIISDRMKYKNGAEKPSKEEKKILLKGGIICGIFLCIATTVQTWGLMYTTSGKSGFITAMYIIFVPFIGLLLKRSFPKIAFLSAFIALVGMYLLCGFNDGFDFNIGDFLTLICAVVFSLHIIAIDIFSPKADGIKLSALQFFFAGIIDFVIIVLFDKPDIGLIIDCTLPILYSGVMSCGVAYTLQIIGQKYTDPASASILMSLESVFAVLSGMLILGEAMNGIEILGCMLMFAAIIINTLKS